MVRIPTLFPGCNPLGHAPSDNFHHVSQELRAIPVGPLTFAPGRTADPQGPENGCRASHIAGIPYRGWYVFEKPFRVLLTVKVPSRRTVSLINFASHGSCRLAMKSAGAFFGPPAWE